MPADEPKSELPPTPGAVKTAAADGGPAATPADGGARPQQVASAWRDRYAEKHRLARVRDFPAGVTPPKRVRIYARPAYHLLQFWDPSVKRTLYQRVDGDLVDAIAHARRIDQRLADSRRSGVARGRVEHEQLVRLYTADVEKRVEAGLLAASSGGRYAAALRHYTDFAALPRVLAAHPHAGRVDRGFALDFVAHLNQLQVSPNGHPNTTTSTMRSPHYVQDVVRAAFDWAADPDRGNLLPGFSNPFRRHLLPRRRVARDLADEPEITPQMAADLLAACDTYQLRIFAPLVFYGPRPSELVFAFHEKLDAQFLSLECIESLAYLTKGRRDKRLPMLGPLLALLRPAAGATAAQGLIYVRREVVQGDVQPGLLGLGLPELVEEFQRRCAAGAVNSVRKRLKVRDTVLRDAGAVGYRHILAEFQTLTHALGWPKQATLKDLRHACNTSLSNGGLGEQERRYLLGQSPGRHAIVNYTHLNRLARHYLGAVEKEMKPLLDIIYRRAAHQEAVGRPDDGIPSDASAPAWPPVSKVG